MITNKKEDGIQNEIEFRLMFRREYGIDYLEALDRLKKQRQKTETKWNQLLVNNKLIK